MIDVIGSPSMAYAVLLIVTAIARLRCGSWFAPAAFVGLVWSFFIGASLLVVDYPVPGRGLWMLVLLVVAIQLGALIAHELSPLSPGISASDLTATLDSLIVPCRRYALLCATVALIGCVYFLFLSLEQFDLPLTWIGVMEVGAKWTLLRYEDALEPLSVRLLITWFHPAALLGGILFACSHRRLDRTAGVGILLPSVVYGIFTGARAAILLGLTCWLGGYVATLCVRNHGRLAMFSTRRVALLSLGALAMLGMFGGIDAVRDTSSSQAILFDLQEQKLSNYMFGSPAAFADWYAHANISGALWGAQTFANEFDVLQLRPRIIGRYLDKSNLVGTETTNVYTIFRGFIEDFTVSGAMLVAAGIGGFAGWIYGGSSSNARRAVLWLSAFYGAMLYGPIVCLFSFNGAALAWLVGWLVLTWTRPRPFPSDLPLLSAPEAP